MQCRQPIRRCNRDRRNDRQIFGCPQRNIEHHPDQQRHHDSAGTVEVMQFGITAIEPGPAAGAGEPGDRLRLLVSFVKPAQR